MIWDGRLSQLEGGNFLKTAVAYMHLNQLLTTAGKKKSLKRLLNKYFFILLLAFYRYKAYSML